MQAIGWQPQRAPDGTPVHYERHGPEQTTLYRLVQQYAATFFAQAEDAAGADLPHFVKDEFDAFLECGILAHGFLRLRCGDCGHDKLVAFSCKRRGFCPSCGARRMAQTAAHLVDHVIPHVPVRQWVLSLPIPLRLLLATQPKLVTPVLQVVHRVITRFLLKQAGVKADEADSGAVTLIQRFGSAANLNIHLHCLVLDGVYRRGIDGAPEFVEVPEPTDEALQAVLHKIITCTMKLLTRRGVLVEEEGSTYLADNDGDSDEARVLSPLQAAACTYRIAFGPRAGQKVLTQQGAMPRETDFKQTLCADINGFSLHAAVRCAADDRQALEQLLPLHHAPGTGQRTRAEQRCWASGAEAENALARRHHASGDVAAGVHATPDRIGATPKAALIRFHGVLAPNAKLRELVVPQEPESPTQAAQPAQCEANCAHHRPVRLSWAKLLKHVFDLDLEHCPNCGGELKIIAAILEARERRFSAALSTLNRTRPSPKTDSHAWVPCSECHGEGKKSV